MIIELPGTTTGAINKKLVELRESGGAVTLGRVLTLVVCTRDSKNSEDVIDAANEASREHPCRVIVVARGSRSEETHLDAEIRVGGDAGAAVLWCVALALAGYVWAVSLFKKRA